MNESTESKLYKTARPVGIVGYGAYIPRYRLPGKEVLRVWKGGQGGSPVEEKAVGEDDGLPAAAADEGWRIKICSMVLGRPRLGLAWHHAGERVT